MIDFFVRMIVLENKAFAKIRFKDVYFSLYNKHIYNFLKKLSKLVVSIKKVVMFV